MVASWGPLQVARRVVSTVARKVALTADSLAVQTVVKKEQKSVAKMAAWKGARMVVQLVAEKAAL